MHTNPSRCPHLWIGLYADLVNPIPPAAASAPGLGDPQGSGRCLVMGVVNTTPDSFSDGGRWLDADAAVARGLELIDSGADLIDVGGESTRPGAERVPVQEELRRVVPVVEALAGRSVTVGVDTTRAEVAHAAVRAGAGFINDVSGGLADPEIVDVVREAGVPYVVMHWRGHSDVMDSLAVYDDVVSEVIAELMDRVDALLTAGLDRESLVLDPGFGFAKAAEHNWRLLAALPRLVALGYPVLVGTSRKRFLAQAITSESGEPMSRDDATAATTVLAAAAGVWAVRVHEVAASATAVRVVARAMTVCDA